MDSHTLYAYGAFVYFSAAIWEFRQIGSNGGQQRVTTLLYLLPKYDFVFSAMINTENCLPVINMAIAAANEILQIELPKIPLPSNQDVCLEKEPS